MNLPPPRFPPPPLGIPPVIPSPPSKEEDSPENPLPLNEEDFSNNLVLEVSEDCQHLLAVHRNVRGKQQHDASRVTQHGVTSMSQSRDIT